MRKHYFVFKNITSCLFFVLLFLSCSQEYTPDASSGDTDELLFRLHTTGYTGDKSRSTNALIRFDRLDHYIVNEDGNFVSNIRSLYDTNLSQIRVEGIKDGSYYLLVLAVKGDYNADGAIIYKLNDSSSSWLTFQTAAQGKTLLAEYFYTRHAFTVSGGQVINSEIDLQRMVGKVEFQLNFHSDYVRKSVVSMNVIPSADATFGNVLNADGTVSGEQSIGELSLMDENQFLLFPSGEGNSFRGNIVLNSRRHTGEIIEKNYEFSVAVHSNQHSVVNVHVAHPDDNTGTLYIKENDYTPDNFYTILSDSEPKSIYYNASERSFYVNDPLQLSIQDDTLLHLRFYSPLAISDVRVYAKTPEMREYFELGYFTEIPAFADAVFQLPLSEKEAVYHTESRQYISIPAMSQADIRALQFKIVSDDPYWQKITQIEAKWYITFNAYGKDPDLPNGGADSNSNWMGMRPVHAREAIAVLTNVAYLCTLEDFKDWVMTFDGRIMGNDGKTPVDMSTVIPSLQNRPRFNTGLVYSGNGSAGLGGGATWGVFQPAYFGHYTSTYHTRIIFHELGHCLGYSHASGMTEGLWAGGCANVFYVNNIHRLPVYSSSILNSINNPNKY